MRSSPLGFLVFLFAAACGDRALTGPEARRALAQGAPLVRQLPPGFVVLLNGRRLAPGQTLDGLDTAKVVSLDILKLTDSSGGSIRISTTDTEYVGRVTVR